MKLGVFLLAGMVTSTAMAVTYYRVPLYYVPYDITAWKDATPSGDGVTQRYDGEYISSSSSYFYDGHRGTDFGAPYGTTVYNAADGNVYSTVDTCPPNGGYLGNPCGYYFGNFVAIKDVDDFVSIYAHLSVVSVYSGYQSCVTGPGGNKVGESGNSGSSSGSHLHYELRIDDLSASSMSYDPFGGSVSTQTWFRWYDWAWEPDPLNPGYSMSYPITACQP